MDLISVLIIFFTARAAGGSLSYFRSEWRQQRILSTCVLPLQNRDLGHLQCERISLTLLDVTLA